MAPKVIGLILAAGYSSRMGAFKPLLPIGDMAAVERVSAALRSAGINRIIGVTGHRRELLSPVFTAEGIEEAYNSDYDQGMFTSIQAGIRKAAAGLSADDGRFRMQGPGPLKTPDGFFLMLVDCPLVPAEVLKQLLKKHEENPEAFIVPCFRGKKGHPLFIPGQYAEEILAYEGEGGLKAITTRHEDKLIRLEVGMEEVVLDMDTPEGYEEILEFYRRKTDSAGSPATAECTTELRYEEELEGKRLFLIRHGEIRQHREKIFLGQTDVPLSDKGKEQAEMAAEELTRHGVSVSCIYSSDLSRALETAEIIREHLNKIGREAGAEGDERPGIEVIPVSKLREMSLGEWDGRYISEIRDRYPEEYRKRGENLLTYKFGNDSENFYDLQYRAMKGFQSVLKQEREAGDGRRDIVIVAHSGVINVILSGLLHNELADQIGNHIPNGGMVLIDYSNTTKEKQI